MREIEHLLHPHMNMPVDMYFAQSGMSNNVVWVLLNTVRQGCSKGGGVLGGAPPPKI